MPQREQTTREHIITSFPIYPRGYIGKRSTVWQEVGNSLLLLEGDFGVVGLAVGSLHGDGVGTGLC